jgi:hypothetical protein
MDYRLKYLHNYLRLRGMRNEKITACIIFEGIHTGKE